MSDPVADRITALTDELASLDRQAARLSTDRADRAADLERARRIRAEATATAARLEREPQDARELADTLDRLAHRIRTAPRRSFTAMRAQQLLDRITAPSCALSTAEKLDAARGTLRAFSDGLNDDLTLHHPGDRAWNE